MIIYVIEEALIEGGKKREGRPSLFSETSMFRKQNLFYDNVQHQH